MNQLSEQQAKQLCTEDVIYEQSVFSRDMVVEYVCRLEGIGSTVLFLPATASDAEIQAACTAAYDQCKADPTSIKPSDPAVVCASAMADLATCGAKATVDSFAACVDETVALAPRVLVPCNQLTKAKVEEYLTSSSPACTALDEQCPDLAAAALMKSSPLKLMKR